MLKLRDIKYVLAFSLPLVAWIGLQYRGWWSFGAFILAFVCIPILEVVLEGSEENPDPDEEARLNRMRWFDYLLYLNVPLLAYLMYLYLDGITTWDLDLYEVVGLTLSQGIIIGSIGINIAHELGHRPEPHHQWMARLLLLPGLYMHFNIEHNRGHHKFVATPEDPSSARFGETIYAFWWRSVTGAYAKAWSLEGERLEKIEKPYWSLHNLMIQYQIFQVVYLAVVWYFFGLTGLIMAVAAGVIGFLLLESVNYIEHYGLQRKKQANGRYEHVDFRHSWNSNHDLGRIFLFELTRHSDHHFKASKKYQVLKNYDESPQLPLGYPASILMALVPPLWFRKVNPIVQRINAA
jgi:alkane 1-monooxygenase